MLLFQRVDDCWIIDDGSHRRPILFDLPLPSPLILHPALAEQIAERNLFAFCPNLNLTEVCTI